VTVDGKHDTYSSDDGTFQLTDIPAGSHTLHFSSFGARDFSAPFFVKDGVEEQTVGDVDLAQTVFLAGEWTIVRENNNDFVFQDRPTKFNYDLTVWLQADDDVLAQIKKVTYTLPPQLQLQSSVVSVASPNNKYCYKVSGYIVEPNQFAAEGPVKVGMDYARSDESGTLTLSYSSQNALSSHGGVKPSGCL